MASTLTPTRTSDRPTAASSRFGYAIAIAVNAGLLWITHQLLGWGWPGFLTGDFERVLGILSASLVAGMAVNACFLAYDRGRFRALGDLVTGSFALAAILRLWDVFPFDFTAYASDWSWVVRLGLALGILGTAIGLLVAVFKLVRGPSTGPSKAR